MRSCDPTPLLYIFVNKICLNSSLNIAFIVANSENPDEMQQTTLSGVSSIHLGLYPIIRGFQSSNASGAKNIKKFFLSETTRPRALILCL